MSLNLLSEALNSNLRNLAKFSLVGFLTAAIYFQMMWFADVILGLPYILAISMAYCMSMIFHFVANKYFIFAVAGKSYKAEILRYLLMWFINFLITIMVVSVCVNLLQLSPYLGVCVSVLFSMCCSYIMCRFWVFKVKEETE
jgi:putative flippase GtrA